MKLLYTNAYGKLTREAIAERLKLVILHLLAGNNPTNPKTKLQLKVDKANLKQLDSKELEKFLLFGSAIDPQSYKISIGDVFDSNEIEKLTTIINAYIKKGSGSQTLTKSIEDFVAEAPITSTVASQPTFFSKITLPQNPKDQAALSLTGVAFLLALYNQPFYTFATLFAAGITWKSEEAWDFVLDKVEDKLNNYLDKKHSHQ